MLQGIYTIAIVTILALENCYYNFAYTYYTQVILLRTNMMLYNVMLVLRIINLI